MADDGEVLRQVWHSYLPVVFRLAANEVTSLREPDPYYAMVSRMSYFPLSLDKVVKHLSRFADNLSATTDLWLDFEGIPLKWHFPVGVLWDLLGGESSLPWTLGVHFQDFPEDQVLRCCSRAAIEALLMSALKEADALKHRSHVMASLQKKDHQQLWSGVANDKFDQFWAVNRKLMDAEADARHFRHIPFRVYTDDEPCVRQKLVKATQESGSETTFADLKRAVMGPKAGLYRWVVHGVEVPEETPLEWMSRHLSHCDNFLHICAVKKKS